MILLAIAAIVIGLVVYMFGFAHGQSYGRAQSLEEIYCESGGDGS